MNPVAVVSTGSANIASMLAGLERAGAAPHVCEHARAVRESTSVVVPGVGTFASAMAALRRMNMVEVLQERVAAGKPTLFVCVGLQVLFETSEESPGVAGLGIVPGQIARFSSRVRVPQFGWNRVQVASNSQARFLREGHAYFANSFCACVAPPGWTVANAEYDGSFIAGMERGMVLACQFHPELSGHWGQQLLARWVACDRQEVTHVV